MRLPDDPDTDRLIASDVPPGAGFSRVILDAGHGMGNRHAEWMDHGAEANGTNEHAVVEQLRADIVRELHTDIVQVENDGKNLHDKGEQIGAAFTQGAVFVSLHMNSASGASSGVEVLYDGGRPEYAHEAAALATCVANAEGLPNRGALPDTASHEGGVYVLRAAPGRGFLIETGFISNVRDLNAVRTKGAHAVAQCITSVFGAPQAVAATDDCTLPAPAVSSSDAPEDFTPKNGRFAKVPKAYAPLYEAACREYHIPVRYLAADGSYETHFDTNSMADNQTSCGIHGFHKNSSKPWPQNWGFKDLAACHDPAQNIRKAAESWRNNLDTKCAGDIGCAIRLHNGASAYGYQQAVMNGARLYQ